MNPSAPDFRSGFVGLAGVPNVGKSTLVNALVRQKISIASPSPQTTRHRVGAILTEPRFQAILVDLPGILETKDRFNRHLVHCADSALRGSDLILHVRSAKTAAGEDEARLIEILGSLNAPLFEVWNKIDLKASPRNPISSLRYRRSFRISAKTGRGLDSLREALPSALPPGPLLFPEDDLSDRDLRFLAAERVREKIFIFLREEVPYGVATWTESWEERQDAKTLIRVIIQTDRKRHRQIILGQGGSMIKRIGSAARREIEELIDHPVFLELLVRVKPKWRANRIELERLGLISGDTC